MTIDGCSRYCGTSAVPPTRSSAMSWPPSDRSRRDRRSISIAMTPAIVRDNRGAIGVAVSPRGTFLFPPSHPIRKAEIRWFARFGLLEPFPQARPTGFEPLTFGSVDRGLDTSFGSSKPNLPARLAKNSPENRSSDACHGPGPPRGRPHCLPTDAAWGQKASARSALQHRPPVFVRGRRELPAGWRLCAAVNSPRLRFPWRSV